jgi:small subunit ribosomal protein S18
MPPKSRSKNKDNARRAKKKTSILITEGVEYVDWKDVNLLRRFMSDRSKIRARRVTGNSAQQQADVAMAIKNAREMALLPYVTRITQQRGGRGDRGGRGGGRDDRGPREDRGGRDDRGGGRDDRGGRPPRSGPPSQAPAEGAPKADGEAAASAAESNGGES